MTSSQGFTQKLYDAAAAADREAGGGAPAPRSRPTTTWSTPRSSTTSSRRRPGRSPWPTSSPSPGRPGRGGRRGRAPRRPRSPLRRSRCRWSRSWPTSSGSPPSATSSATPTSAPRPTSTTSASRPSAASTTRWPAPRAASWSGCCPVLDACDSALAHGAAEVEPIVAALLGALEKEGLVRVDPIGEVFDPTVAEAVVHEPGDGGDHIVSEVMRAGLHVAGPRAPPRHGEGHRLTDGAKGGVMAPQREWFEKDYYRVLGVSETASAKEIKSAYRKLSRQYHPDANEGDAAAEERFKEVSAAYDVVGNDERRKEYDEVRRLGSGRRRVPRWRRRRAGSPSRTAATSATCSAACSVAVAAAAVGRGGRGPHRGQDLETELHLTFDDAVAGLTTAVHLTSDAPCHTCNGSGRRAGHQPAALRATAAARAWCPTTRACSRSRRRARCAAAVASRSTTRARRAGAPASSAARARSRCASPPAWPTASASGSRAAAVPGRTAAPPATSTSWCACRRTRSSPARATTSPSPCRSRSRRRPSAPTSPCPPSTGARSRVRIPPGTRSGRTFRVKGKGVATREGHRRPAGHRGGGGARQAAAPPSARRSRPSKPHPNGASPREHLGV